MGFWLIKSFKKIRGSDQDTMLLLIKEDGHSIHTSHIILKVQEDDNFVTGVSLYVLEPVCEAPK